jgi:two-component system CheB/CheR fusion protein
MNNLLNSIEIAALFLDRELRIRQFTAPVTRIFKFIPSDVGRLYTDQVSDLIYPEMYDDAREVLRTLAFKEKDIVTHDGRWFNIRIMPYRTFEDKIDGLVITFIDINSSKKLERALQESGILLRSLIRAIPGIIVGYSVKGKIIEFNQEAEMVFGLKREEVIGKNYFDLFIRGSSQKKAENDLKKILNGTLPGRYENIVKSIKGEEFAIEWSAQKLMDEDSQLIGILATGIKKSKK